MRVAAGRAPTYIDVDVEHMPWLVDHCPTHTVPTLPMTAAIDILVAAVARTRTGTQSDRRRSMPRPCGGWCRRLGYGPTFNPPDWIDGKSNCRTTTDQPCAER